VQVSSEALEGNRVTTVSEGRSSDRQTVEASLGELVSTATRDLSLLMRQEIELAKAEARQAAISAGLGAALLGLAGGLALFGTIALTIGFAESLNSLGITRGWAFLIVAGIYLVLAGLLALFGASRLKRVRPPERTLQTVKDDVAWIKHPTVAPRS
jgi:putative superfamily III holin-X